MDDVQRDLVDDLAAEQGALWDVLAAIDDDAWTAPTPAEGWDVRDSVSHLADVDEIARDTVLDGPRSFPRELETKGPEGFNQQGLDRGRAMSGSNVLAWWREAAAGLHDALLGPPPDTRVPWGIGMSVTSLTTARLMETWAHGLDVLAALGVDAVDTDRLRHVAWIGVRALPYAFSVADQPMPEGDLRVELELPSGGRWVAGPEDAPNRITGPAGQFCRVFVQRITRAEATALTAEGPLADAALDVARAYL
jgi:uncharacterized protein (TIGR03084 family)